MGTKSMRLLPQSPSSSASFSIASYAVGLIDGLGFLSYVVGIDVLYFYPCAIAAKIVVAAFFKEAFSLAAIKPNLGFLALAVVAESIGTIVWGDGNLLRTLAFCMSIGLSLPFVSTKYFSAVTYAGCFNSALYLVFWRLGLIQNSFGRFLYFGGQHPNLGSEIFYATSVASVLCGSQRVATFVVPLMTLPVLLMQGRAALIGCAILYAGVLLQWLRQIPRHYLGMIVALLSVPVFILIVGYSDSLGNSLATLLLLDDPYRGSGTGGVGRADRWMQAIEAFGDSPLFGAGSDYSNRLGVLDAHNFVLWALASYGSLGFALVIMLAMMAFRAALVNSKIRLVLLSWSPLFLLNDRFMNLNLYPFIIYIVIMAYSSRTETARRIDAIRLLAPLAARRAR